MLLTAVTTILGLIPMVTGVSYDFHEMALSLVSESTQWWRSMAIVVIFGLMIATVLTLVVVPLLYSLLASAAAAFARLTARFRPRPYESPPGIRFLKALHEVQKHIQSSAKCIFRENRF